MSIASTILIAALLQGGVCTDTSVDVPAVAPAPVVVGPALSSSLEARDTVRRRPRAVEVSDAYALRLRIHKLASYTMIPLFVAQSVAGNQLYQADQGSGQRPDWASNVHSVGAAGLGALFTINTVTGLWNLWESRDVAEGRGRRLAHSVLLLASDAGFTYSGITLASDAKNSQSARERHRNIAYISMGSALAGYGIMLLGNQ